MRDLAGKAAFITGGASGIGLAMGRGFAAAGMRVMLADIEAPALESAVDALRAGGAEVRGVVCDVAVAQSVTAAAEAAIAAFGRVHVVCNNAGVAGGSGVEAISAETWRWVIDVNVLGVVHGVAAFLPHMRGHGEGGHFVNTASMAGFNSGLGFSPYSASKFAVVNMSEGLAAELAAEGIGVSVLCPGFVRTRIWEAQRNRQARYGAAQASSRVLAGLAAQGAEGLDPDDVAAQVVAAVQAGRLYVFTHAGPGWRAEARARADAILAAMEAADSAAD